VFAVVAAYFSVLRLEDFLELESPKVFTAKCPSCGKTKNHFLGGRNPELVFDDQCVECGYKYKINFVDNLLEHRDQDAKGPKPKAKAKAKAKAAPAKEEPVVAAAALISTRRGSFAGSSRRYYSKTHRRSFLSKTTERVQNAVSNILGKRSGDKKVESSTVRLEASATETPVETPAKEEEPKVAEAPAAVETAAAEPEAKAAPVKWDSEEIQKLINYAIVKLRIPMNKAWNEIQEKNGTMSVADTMAWIDAENVKRFPDTKAAAKADEKAPAKKGKKEPVVVPFSEQISEGPFAILVVFGQFVMGDKFINTFRGKFIQKHSMVISYFCDLYGVRQRKKREFVQTAKDVGHDIGFLPPGKLFTGFGDGELGKWGLEQWKAQGIDKW
jgi:hypothetical protein